jgi:hypothetical protein
LRRAAYAYADIAEPHSVFESPDKIKVEKYISPVIDNFILIVGYHGARLAPVAVELDNAFHMVMIEFF